ncbi:MAG TPA: CapA family protein [Gillisia sp.]|nr:CapA family protein [Gillisia sp.]
MKRKSLSLLSIFLVLILWLKCEENYSFMKQDTSSIDHSLSIFLCGDVMTGRGIDQILPYSVKPKLYEPYVKDARDYLYLAELKNGRFKYPVSFSNIWGDALEVWKKMSPSIKIVNLETSLTVQDSPWPGKGINYWMHPKNAKVLTSAGIDFCSLANNHILDWERPGLIETLETLKESGIFVVGAGKNAKEAATPGIIPVNGGRLVLLAFGARSSGIPKSWAAQENLSGINILPEEIEASIDLIKNQVAEVKQKNDIVVFSMHWGGNWGYKIPSDHRKLAHEIIDKAGVDIVHGHSSHHPLGMEVYKNKLIIYGAGDFINDYEGITGDHDKYRGELSLMYFPTINQENGELISLKMIPMKIKNFRLNHASKPDAAWLEEILDRKGSKLGTQVELNDDNSMDLKWFKK